MMMKSVHLWLGAFASQKRLDQYLEYTRDEDDDESPINEFAADQSEDHYDHDWMEAIYEQGSSIKTLLESPSYSPAFSKDAINVAKKLNLDDQNTVFMIDSQLIDKPVSANGDGYTLTYLGEFEAASVIHPSALADKSVTKLDLYGKNLTEIPEAVFEMKQLESLNLMDNQLTSLPDALFNLTNLREIYLSTLRLVGLRNYLS